MIRVLLFPDLFKALVAAGALESGCLRQHGVLVLSAHFRSQALELTCTQNTPIGHRNPSRSCRTKVVSRRIIRFQYKLCLKTSCVLQIEAVEHD